MMEIQNARLYKIARQFALSYEQTPSPRAVPAVPKYPLPLSQSNNERQCLLDLGRIMPITSDI